MVVLWRQKQKEHEHHHHHDHGGGSSLGDKVMNGLCGISVLWLLGGMGFILQVARVSSDLRSARALNEKSDH